MFGEVSNSMVERVRLCNRGMLTFSAQLSISSGRRPSAWIATYSISSPSTMRRAYRSLGVVPYQKNNGWWWALPVPRVDVYECEIREWVRDPVTKQFVKDPTTRRLKFEWRVVSVEEALWRVDKPSVRCKACYGPVRLCRTSIYRWTGGPHAACGTPETVQWMSAWRLL